MTQSENNNERLEQPVLRHYCKVCNRGFSCAGALGGHMRSHATGDHNNLHLQLGEDKQQQHLISNFRDRPEGGGSAAGNKHSYFLRNNANRFASYREVEDRGKCLLPAENDGEERRRSITPPLQKSSREEEDLANCLVMLSNKTFVFSSSKNDEENKEAAKEVERAGIFQCKACKKVFNSHQALGGHRASHKKVKGCYAARFDDDNNNNNNHDLDQEDDFISNHDEGNNNTTTTPPADDSPEAASISDVSNQDNHKSSSQQPRKTAAAAAIKAHECSICHRVFSSGQALGGHKRCHWLTSNLTDNTFIPNLHEFHYDPTQHVFKKPFLISNPPAETGTALDLNFPPVFLNFNSPAPEGTDPHQQSSMSMQAFNDSAAKISLQLWGNSNNPITNQSRFQQQEKNNAKNRGDQEKQCKSKNVKLSDLKDLNLDGGGSSRWLQMGIPSTTDIVAAP